MPLPTPKRNRPQHVVTLNPTLVTQAKELALVAGERRLSAILDRGLELYIAERRRMVRQGEAAPTPTPTGQVVRDS